jgi:phospholipid/cholesterol/gamma-HCH transport system substrate-binding protein
LNQETKVGVFTMAGLALFAASVLILGDVTIKQRYPLHIYFEDAEGLPDKGPVKVAGVEVGLVEGKVLDGQRAKVTVRMNKGVRVHADARATIASTGLIGSKYLELALGGPEAPVLEPGDTLVGEPSVSFDDIMKKAGEFFRDDPEHGSPSENARETLANLRNISKALNAALGQQQRELVEIVQNVRSLTGHVDNISRNLDEVLEGQRGDLETLLAKSRSISERLDDLLARIQRGEGTVGKLMSDKEMGEDLKETVSSVKAAAKEAKSILGRIALIETYWDYRQRYDFEDEQWRADVGLRIVPRKGKFYFLQGNNLGTRQDRNDPANDFEKKNTLTAVMGRDFGPVTLYGGVIRSAGGAGVRVRPLPWAPWQRRLELEAEAYDFPRDEVVRGVELDKPVYNAGARVLVKDPWLWVGGQVEDIAERQNFNANMNITFKDEDIAYLLGLVGLAR